MAPHRGTRLRRRWSALAGVFALLLLPLGPSAAAQEGGSLYEWTDDKGVVRYTPDPGRVPRGRRGSMRIVEPGAWTAPAVPAPRSGSYEGTGQSAGAPPEPSTLEAFGVATPEPPPGEPVHAADPFNAPSTPRSVQGEEVDDRPPPDPWVEGTPTATVNAPGDPRIAELEAAIARDEDRLKELISAEGEGLESDPELREIGRRLPQLHRALRELQERSLPGGR